MTSELTNLLPRSNKNALRREYFMRLVTVSIFLLTGIVFAEGLLLLPSYMYERQVADSDSAELKQLASSLATTQEQEVQTRLTTLQTESTYLLGMNKIPEASTALRDVLAVPHPGISITGYAFATASKGVVPNIQVIGTANTRENLRSFDAALGQLPFVTSANLPISDYAKDTNIPFTITLTGSLLAS